MLVQPINDTLPNARVPVVGFVAFSGTGKTTLLTQLIPLLRAQGIRLAAIKHSHHNFDIDTPGKDSYALRKAGVNQMLVASYKRWALMVENHPGDDDNAKEPDLNTLIGQLNQSTIDLILVEGFKHEAFAKIELHRPELGRDRHYPTDENIIAFATPGHELIHKPTRPIPFLDMNNPISISDFLITHFKLKIQPHNT